MRGTETVREDLGGTDEEGGFRMIRNPPSRRVWGCYDPGGDGGGLRGDQPGPLLLAHAAPDPVGLADRQRVLEAGVEHRAPGAHGLGRVLATGPGRTAFAVGVEEEGRVLATACAVELPVPDLGDGCREPANVGHLSSRARREPEGAVRLLQGPGALALTWSNTP